jgi:pSer/pThr/pTyr-binding forkhead associated (FHA) protein
MAVLRLVPATGNPVEITEDAVLVGREPSCDVVIPDGSISRRHARIEKRPQGYTVVDQGSANGTFLDSQRVAESVLKNGQELRFGAVGFKVQLQDDDDLSATIVATAPPPERTLTTPPPLSTPPPAPAAPPPPRATTPVPAAPGAGAPPPLPKAGPPPLKSNPPTDPVATPKRPATAVPPPPPSSAAAKERFGGGSRPAPPPSDAGAAPSSAPRKSGRGAGFWIGAGCVGCLFILILFVVAGFAIFLFATSGPATAAETRLKQIKENPLGAYAEASENFRQACSEMEYSGYLARHPGLTSSKAPSIGWSRQVSFDSNVGGRASLPATLEDDSGRKESGRVLLVSQGDDWRLAGLQFEGGDGDGCR